MNPQELKKQLITEEFRHKTAIHDLCQKYANDNARYSIGDFVYNVTGIIKVDKITYDKVLDNIDIAYIGLRYKRLKGELLRTKDNKPAKLVYNLMATS